MRRTRTMCVRNSLRLTFLLLIGIRPGACQSQEIQSIYLDLSLPGHWEPAKQYAPSQSGAEIFYDSESGTVVLIREQAGLQRVGEIAKYFDEPKGTTPEAASLIATSEFPLPLGYVERATKDLGKGNKPAKMWEVREGDGNPLWFYTSQLFDTYRSKDRGGASEVTEEYMAVRVSKAEQLSVSGGDALLLEVETERPASEAVLKHFHMPGALKDQRVRYGWVQFAPGGIASGQGVVSVAFAAAASSNLKVEDVARQVAAGKIKPL